jgi:hypothetical protein
VGLRNAALAVISSASHLLLFEGPVQCLARHVVEGAFEAAVAGVGQGLAVAADASRSQARLAWLSRASVGVVMVDGD